MVKKQRSPYISNLPPKDNPENAIPWICRACKQTQNEDGRCANIANNLCPKCFSEELHKDDEKICERCGAETDKLYDFETKDEDEYGDEIEVKMKICWDCDWDICNGGDIHKDSWDIISDRKENAYEYDPINNPRPY